MASRVARPARRFLLLLAFGLLAFAGGPGTAAADPPSIEAGAAIAVEVSSGDVVYSRRSDDQRSIASTTKLMTALVALEREPDLEAKITVPEYDAAPAESLAGIHAGDRMTLRDLLGAMLLPSGNDAAVAIAKGVGGSVPRFVELMNDRSRSLGLDARFRNPVGLDEPGHHASAADLVKLTLMLRRYPAFRTIVDRKSMRLESATPPITVVNRNTLVQTVPWVDGVKTGHTSKAGYALVGSGRRHGVSVITVVLGDPSEGARDSDSLALLRYAIGRYHRVRPVKQGAVVARLPLRYRDARADIVAATTVTRVARRGQPVTTRVVDLPADVEGPVAKGTRLGTIEVLQRGKVVERVPAVTAGDIAQASFWERADDHLGRPWVRVLIVLALLCGIALAVLLRRSPRSRRSPDEAVS